MPLTASQSPSSLTPAPIVVPDATPDAARAAPQIVAETHRRLRRPLTGRDLHAYAVLTIVLIVVLAAFVASNTGRVKVDWVFGSYRVPIVWMALCTAILGWLIGVLTTTVFRWRTRAPPIPRLNPIASPDKTQEIS